MANQGLIFIPDISGFSRFVTQTEIEHSRLIIQELLETLINANHIGLEVSEIEGDAILFYRFGNLPSLEELYSQVESMFCSFHRSLHAYDLRKYCQCNACIASRDLTLKVITHYGEFTGYSVKSFNKLIGRDIIVAHELLKNDIEQHEYWLVTHSLSPRGRPDAVATWMQWNTGAKQTQGGEVSFHYAQLSQLKDTIPLEPLSQVELTRGARMLGASRDYETDIITLFHATGDFNYRSSWQEGVKSVEEVEHLLPRVGMRCRCTLESGGSLTYSSSYYDYGADRIEFHETEEDSEDITRFVLQRIDADLTRLTVEHYVMRGRAAEILFRVTRKRAMERTLEKSLNNLVDAVKEIHLPGNGDARSG